MSKDAKHFYCKACKEYWYSDQWVLNDDEAPVGACPSCDKPTLEVPYYYANIPKMRKNATGPKTADGKKRASMNAYKHGLYADHHHSLLAPALRGKFPECNGCSYYDDCGDTLKYCPVNLQLITKFIQAFEEGKVDDLKQFTGVIHGHTAYTLKMLFQDIFKHGTLVPHKLRTVIDDDGLSKHSVLEWQGNPSVKRIVELMTALGLTADQQMMTPAKKVDDDNVKGFLHAEENKRDDLNEYMDKQKLAMEKLRQDILKGQAAAADDEALKEWEKEHGDGNEKTD